MLSDEPAERLQRLLAIRFWDRLPELLQRDQSRRRNKKTPSLLERMTFLLGLRYDTIEANQRASKERILTIAENQRRVDTG